MMKNQTLKIKEIFLLFSVSISLVFASNLMALAAKASSNFFPMKINNQSSFYDTGIDKSIIVHGEKPVLVSSQFAFTEGPASDKEGNIFFTDQPNNKIWKYDLNGELSVFMENSGRSNGMFFDKNDNLIACADEHNQLWSIDKNKKITVLLKDYNGQTLNGPNDVWVNPVSGGAYFTDPYYKRDYWKKEHPPQRKQQVYFLPKNKKKAIIVETEIEKPNGVIGTADGKFLFIADIGSGKVFKYNISNDGKLINKKLFVNHSVDGMTIDSEENIYMAGKGVSVYNPEGKLIEYIPIPESWTANVCFGGKDKSILFISASKSIYVLKMNVKGVQ
ncbi:MAG: SMP-30/gluconolactonase/LRE family protein [Ginsengibacter sp.]